MFSRCTVLPLHFNDFKLKSMTQMLYLIIFCFFILFSTEWPGRRSLTWASLCDRFAKWRLSTSGTLQMNGVNSAEPKYAVPYTMIGQNFVAILYAEMRSDSNANISLQLVHFHYPALYLQATWIWNLYESIYIFYNSSLNNYNDWDCNVFVHRTV